MLPRLLETLRNQTVSGSVRRVLVVADHCSDSTAEVARRGGAEVLERSSGPRGKPAALRDGLAWLKEMDMADGGQANYSNDATKHSCPVGPPSAGHGTQPSSPMQRAVLILDADCTVSANFVEEIVRAMEGGDGAAVVQSAYRLESALSPQKMGTPATIAFALKNVVRPTGMGRLGIPTQLFGTGMCFRAEVLEKLTFEDHLTEDLKISHDLLVAGIYPVFVGEAVVSSPLPAERKAMTTQKMRWETGQIQTWAKLPRIVWRLARRGRVAGIVALMDWSAPPVAMAGAYWFLLTVLTGLCVYFSVARVGVLIVPAVCGGMLFVYVVAGALQASGVAATVKLFLATPRFALWKLSLYVRMIRGGGARTWERTERGAEARRRRPRRRNRAKCGRAFR